MADTPTQMQELLHELETLRQRQREREDIATRLQALFNGSYPDWYPPTLVLGELMLRIAKALEVAHEDVLVSVDAWGGVTTMPSSKKNVQNAGATAKSIPGKPIGPILLARLVEALQATHPHQEQVTDVRASFGQLEEVKREALRANGAEVVEESGRVVVTFETIPLIELVEIADMHDTFVILGRGQDEVIHATSSSLRDWLKENR